MLPAVPEPVELDSRAQDFYRQHGYVVLEGAVSLEVIEPVLQAVGRDGLAVIDSAGNRQELNVWSQCGDDLIGRIPRSDLFVDLAEGLIGEDVYHWHSKISWKRPGSEGTWDWHQDFGFWADEGCARPAMTTLSVALDRHDEANGCLSVIPGSHHPGVIAHPPVGHSRAADPARVQELIASQGRVHLELNPGDLVAFHCNTLHASGPNRTDRQRTMLHCSYNAKSNPPDRPAMEGHQVTGLHRVPNASLRPGHWDRVWGHTRFVAASDDGYGGHDGYQVLAAGPVAD